MNDANGAVLECRNIARRFSEGDSVLEVLSGVNLDIPKAKLISIVGASGSGKSTLLNILGCIDRPTSGQYELCGDRIDSYSRAKLAAIRSRDLGHIFQQYHLIDHLTVEDNLSVRFPYGEHPVPEDFRTVIHVTLRNLGLAQLSQKYPRHLSGGEMQRRILSEHEPTYRFELASFHPL